MIGPGAPLSDFPGAGAGAGCLANSAGGPRLELNRRHSKWLFRASGTIQNSIRGCRRTPLRPKIKGKEGAAARGVCGAGLGSRPGGHQKLKKFALTFVGLVAGALIFVGCGAGSPTARPTPTSTPTAAWELSYTPDQIADYTRAVAVYQRIEREEAPIWAAGTVTTAARAEFSQDWANPNVPLNLLKFFQQSGVKTEGVPTLLASQLQKVSQLAGVGEVLQIRECVDTASVHETQRGKAVRNPFPHLARLIEVVKTPAGRFAAASVQALRAC